MADHFELKPCEVADPLEPPRLPTSRRPAPSRSPTQTASDDANIDDNELVLDPACLEQPPPEPEDFPRIVGDPWIDLLRAAFRGDPEDFDRLLALYLRRERDLWIHRDETVEFL